MLCVVITATQLATSARSFAALQQAAAALSTYRPRCFSGVLLTAGCGRSTRSVLPGYRTIGCLSCCAPASGGKSRPVALQQNRCAHPCAASGRTGRWARAASALPARGPLLATAWPCTLPTGSCRLCCRQSVTTFAHHLHRDSGSRLCLPIAPAESFVLLCSSACGRYHHRSNLEFVFPVRCLKAVIPTYCTLSLSGDGCSPSIEHGRNPAGVPCLSSSCCCNAVPTCTLAVSREPTFRLLCPCRRVAQHSQLQAPRHQSGRCTAKAALYSALVTGGQLSRAGAVQLPSEFPSRCD